MRRSPAAGEIWWCYFPDRERSSKPGPKLRPALIVKIVKDQTATLTVATAYGTSQAHGPLRTWDFAAGTLAGESRSTVFDMRRIVLLPFTSEYFPQDKPLQALNEHQLREAVDALKAAIDHVRLTRR